MSSKPIQEHVLLSRKRHCVCVPRLFSLKTIVSDKEQSVPTSEDMKEYETYEYENMRMFSLWESSTFR